MARAAGPAHLRPPPNPHRTGPTGAPPHPERRGSPSTPARRGAAEPQRHGAADGRLQADRIADARAARGGPARPPGRRHGRTAGPVGTALRDQPRGRVRRRSRRHPAAHPRPGGRPGRRRDRRARAASDPAARRAAVRATHSTPWTRRSRPPNSRASDLSCAVVAATGSYDADADRLRFARHLNGWNGVGLVRRLEAELGVPVFVENDVNLAAIAERRVGAAQDIADFFLLWAGDGIGGALILEDRLHRGSSGGAGEIAFLQPPGAALVRNPVRGGSGALERWVGGASSPTSLTPTACAARTAPPSSLPRWRPRIVGPRPSSTPWPRATPSDSPRSSPSWTPGPSCSPAPSSRQEGTSSARASPTT